MLPATIITTVGLALANTSTAAAATKTYFIDVTTCNDFGAGTDASIWLKIDGTLTSTGWKLLDNPNVDDFEQGQE